MKKFYSIIALFIFLLPLNNVIAQAILLDDNHSLFGFPFNGKIFLISNMDSTLWTSDGTATGTFQYSPVKMDNGGFSVLNNKIYFAGLNATNGSELWVTDGITSPATHLVFDIWPGSDSSKPQDFFTYQNNLYFTAFTPSLGRELYQYSGSGSPTSVTDLNSGSGNSFTDNFLLYPNPNANMLFFNATNNTGNSIYVMQGSSITKMFDLPSDFLPIAYSEIGTTTFFIISNGSDEVRLYKTNGTSVGTTLLKTFSSPFAGMFHSQMISWKNKIFLTASESGMDNEIWVSDGTTTQLLADINPGSNGSFPLLNNYVVLKDNLIFSASTDDSGYELWMTDGTSSGTKMLKDLNTQSGEGSNPVLFQVFTGFTLEQPPAPDLNLNGYIFFSADDGVHGTELWKTDGTSANTVMVKDINPSGDGVTGTFIYTKEGFIFSGDDGINGSEPWISDGSAIGTHGIVNINLSGDSDPFFYFVWKGDVYLAADNGNSGSTGSFDFFKLQGPYVSLPVTLKDFNATVTSQYVLLNWKTSSESNSDQFIITRSTDGIFFNEIGTVAAAGNSNTWIFYSYTDREAYNQGTEKLFYRLEMKDKDGKKDYSKIITANLNGLQARLIIYPNPADVNLNVKYNTRSNGTITITDLNGRTLYKSLIKPSANGVYKINVSALSAGNYFIKLTEGRNSTIEKFIKK